MAQVNLDRLRAAREARDPHTVTLDGVEYDLPADPPALFAVKAARGDLEGALLELFGESAGEFLRAATFDDIKALFQALEPIYGLDGLGESSASGDSSSSTSRPSRPISRGTTRSTSSKRSAEPASA